MPLPKPEFPNYDPAIGDALAKAGGSGGGLPDYLGIRTVEVGPGRMTCVMPVRDELLNPFGSLHGGAISALTDHVLGAVLYGVIERGAWAATTEFKLNLMAPVRSGEVTAEAEIVSMTKRTAVVRVDITNLGRAAGAGQGTVLIMPPRA